MSPAKRRSDNSCHHDRRAPALSSFLGIDLSAPLSSKEFVRRVREAEALNPRPDVRRKAAEMEVEVIELPPVRSVVYFIQAASGGPVKIGVTTDLGARLSGLQTAHPEQLRVLHSTPGDATDEAYFHARFAHLRLRGEWFRHEGTLSAYLETKDA